MSDQTSPSEQSASILSEEDRITADKDISHLLTWLSLPKELQPETEADLEQLLEQFGISGEELASFLNAIEQTE